MHLKYWKNNSVVHANKFHCYWWEIISEHPDENTHNTDTCTKIFYERHRRLTTTKAEKSKDGRTDQWLVVCTHNVAVAAKVKCGTIRRLSPTNVEGYLLDGGRQRVSCSSQGGSWVVAVAVLPCSDVRGTDVADTTDRRSATDLRQHD